jgi:Tol biopolymer transport system component
MRRRSWNGAPWSTPVNLGVANSAFVDVTPSLSHDGMMLVFASNRPGSSGALDLYYMTRTIVGHK